MERFNEYINENVAPNKDLAQDWVFGHLDVSFYYFTSELVIFIYIS